MPDLRQVDPRRVESSRWCLRHGTVSTGLPRHVLRHINYHLVLRCIGSVRPDWRAPEGSLSVRRSAVVVAWPHAGIRSRIGSPGSALRTGRPFAPKHSCHFLAPLLLHHSEHNLLVARTFLALIIRDLHGRPKPHVSVQELSGRRTSLRRNVILFQFVLHFFLVRGIIQGTEQDQLGRHIQSRRPLAPTLPRPRAAATRQTRVNMTIHVHMMHVLPAYWTRHERRRRRPWPCRPSRSGSRRATTPSPRTLLSRPPWIIFFTR